MDKRNSQRSGKLLAAAVASVGLAGFAASQADASMVIDVRALTVTAGAGNSVISGGKSVVLGNATSGATVTLGVFARISGTNTAQQVIDLNGDGSELMTINDDTIQSIVGAFTSGTGPLKGNMGSAVAGPNNVYPTTANPFNAAGATNGAFADFDSDGDLDLGALGTDPTNMWAARAAAPTLGAHTDVNAKGYSSAPFASFNNNTNDSLIDATTSEVRVGTLRFIATGGGGSTDLQFVVRQNGDAAGLWFEDGVTTGKNPTNSPFSTGTPVNVATVPEPATVGLLGLASLGLLARRRKQV